MNILTFDIEEWAIAKANGIGNPALYAEYESFLDRILDKLDERGIKATFFCLGMMALDFPEIVKKIDSRGHEIGCHSNKHLWVNKMTEDEFRKDTHDAISSLEDCIGKKVLSYRAPAFSIGESNLWAFDVLAENGIERDASVFPAVRDFGGFPSFGYEEPCMIKHNGVSIKEFPITMTSVFGKRLAYSGGGYFRFFPLRFVKSRLFNSIYSMCYFHIGDLIPESKSVMTRSEYEEYFKEKGSIINRYKRFFKSNVGKRTAFNKLSQLIEEMSFMCLDNADEEFEWTKAPIVAF